MKKFFRHKEGAASQAFDKAALSGVINSIAPDKASQSITMLSLSPEAQDSVYVTREEVRDDVTSILGENLSPAAQEAATMAAFQVANIEEANRAAVAGIKSVGTDYSGSLSLQGAGGDLGQVSVNMQSYDNRDFSKYRESSIRFNAASADQDAVSELFFPSLLLSADAPFLRCTLRSTVVQRNVTHSRTGEVTDLGRKNLANAYTNPEILENNSTEVFPIVAADNSNASAFVSASRVAPYDVMVDGKLEKTAPLKVGTSGNLLGLASVGSYAPEEGYTAYDQLNPRAMLDKIFVEVTDGTETDQVAFTVKGLPRANFVKSPQPDSNDDFMLKFATDTFSISAETKDRTGTVAPSLAGIPNGTSLRVRLRAAADLNLNDSNYHLESASLEVIGAFDANGPVKIEGALKSAVDALSFDAYGITLADITRTNSNRSTLGLWVDSTSHHRDFAVHAQAPIYHPRPTDETPEQDVIDSLIRASKAVSTNRTIAAMRNHLDTLAAFVEMGDSTITSDQMFPGAAAEITPYYKSVDLKIKTMLNSISTHEKADDIRGLFSTVMTHYVGQMINRSNIETATAMIHGSVKKPELIIATDPEIAPWLMISGDADLLGRMVNYKVASSVHPDMVGRIVVSFASDTSIDGIDPCGFGRRGWLTQVVAQNTTTRGSSTNKEVVIQPRELPVAALPVALEFVVTELDEAIEESL